MKKALHTVAPLLLFVGGILYYFSDISDGLASCLIVSGYGLHLVEQRVTRLRMASVVRGLPRVVIALVLIFLIAGERLWDTRQLADDNVIIVSQSYSRRRAFHEEDRD